MLEIEWETSQVNGKYFVIFMPVWLKFIYLFPNVSVKSFDIPSIDAKIYILARSLYRDKLKFQYEYDNFLSLFQMSVSIISQRKLEH